MPQRAHEALEIEAPVETVYGYWETLENLPHFMKNVEEVQVTGPDTSRWKVKGPFGKTLEFDAEIAQKEPNRTIGWIATAGDIGNSGQVVFQDIGPNRTWLEVTREYSNPPGGKVGEVASRVVSNPQRMLEQDLKNLKEILEGRATPEEIQQDPAAATAQSGSVAFLTGMGLLLIGIGALALFLLRRQGSAPSRPTEMNIRVIPTSVHGVLDYVTGNTLFAAPKLFRLKDVRSSARAARLAGAGAIVKSLMTDYELGAVKVLPMPVHLMLDALSGALLATSPWLFGFGKSGRRYWLPHTVAGTTEILVAAMSKTQPSYKAKQS